MVDTYNKGTSAGDTAGFPHSWLVGRRLVLRLYEMGPLHSVLGVARNAAGAAQPLRSPTRRGMTPEVLGELYTGYKPAQTGGYSRSGAARRIARGLSWF